MRLSASGFFATTRHDADERVVGVGPMTVVHDQDVRLGELRLGAGLGLGRGLGADWGVGVELPFKVFATDITYRDAAGNVVAIENPDVHHRDETLPGLGDPWLVGRAEWRWGGVSLGARAGLSLPLGATEPDPFALGALGLRHEHFQFGTGTVDPIAGAELVVRVGAVPIGVWALTKQTFLENDHGYQAGDRYAGGASAEAGFGLVDWRFRAGVELQHETAERWNGVVPTDDGNRGRTDVLVNAGARFAVSRDVAVEVAARVPVVQRVVGGQIDMPVVLEIGVRFGAQVFGRPAAPRDDDDGEDDDDDDDDDDDNDDDDDDGEGGDHEHGEGGDHEHGAPADDAEPQAPPGADVADLTDRGEAVPLVGVPGKITVFDFWAPWCQPCKKLTPELYALAAAHPDRVAIRRINVVDWDSAAATTYLAPGSFSLPHLKVLDPSGVLILERSAAPAALVQFVVEILDAMH